MANHDQHFIQRRAFHLADDPLQKSRPAPRQKLLRPGSKTSRFSRSQNQARNTSTHAFASTVASLSNLGTLTLPSPRGKGKGYSETTWSRRHFQTFAGVTGISIWRTPRCHNASTTALTIAAGAPTVADSPTPLAPKG